MTPTTNAPVLEVTGLHFGWPDIPLFQDLSLQLPAGVSVVHGEESSGKTTLLRLLAGDLRADSGAFVLRNTHLQTHADAYRAQVFRTEPRSDALDAISARAWFATLVSRYPGFDLGSAQDLARAFALDPHIDKPMYMLSAGSKRKVWLSAAFAAGTALTLIDEPFAALDMSSIRFLNALLQEASEHTDRAWVLADHAPPEGLALKTRLALGDPPLPRFVRLHD
ncbi:ABC transporter ATP-binding protein [Hydrogenophaga sp. Root209]|uniref:ABC transporter ATP-binding protein n=1 Tax=Hydrogenophaga sp. Root209 TaxID=1736490 RepID=UPI0009E82478|nr:ABC transporter ATP-binding protein [Hydrogenophaga sp. Root209]